VLRVPPWLVHSVMERQLTGKLCLITGANQGLGLQTAEVWGEQCRVLHPHAAARWKPCGRPITHPRTTQELASRGAKVYMVCRDPTRGQAAVTGVRERSGNPDVHLRVCDLSSMASVRTLAGELLTAGVPVHCLVNNAGVMVHERR
jgi:dehydrogenase/reductase SDR family protein 12